MALLGIMYEQDGKVDLTDPVMREVVMEELEIAKDEELDALLDALGSVDFVSAQLLEEHGRAHEQRSLAAGRLQARAQRGREERWRGIGEERRKAIAQARAQASEEANAQASCKASAKADGEAARQAFI